MANSSKIAPLPGSSGIPIVGESFQFLRDPFMFLETRIRRFGDVFQSKLFNFITIFSCNYEATLKFLSQSDRQLKANTAYAEFLGPLYPKPNLMLSPDDSSIRNQSFRLLKIALQDNLHLYTTDMNQVISQHISAITTSRNSNSNNNLATFRPYNLFKRISEDVLTTILLGSMQETQIREIRKLCSDHFNGVVSVPFEFKAFGTRTARSRGIDAYDELVKKIEHALNSACTRQQHGEQPRNVVDVLVNELGKENETNRQQTFDETVQLLLLLLSPAIAKSISGTLTCAVYSLYAEECKQNKFTDELYASIHKSDHLVDYSKIDMLLMETLRMYPPLPGGMRIADGDNVVGGGFVANQSRVWYSLIHCNRDSNVYGKDADAFNPHRWITPITTPNKCPFATPKSTSSSSSSSSTSLNPHNGVTPTPLTFGAGNRHCKGRDVAWMILRSTLYELLRKHKIVNITTAKKQALSWDRNMRHLPILRPNEDSELGLLQIVSQ